MLITLIATLPNRLDALDGALDPTFGGGDGHVIYSGSGIPVDSIPSKVLDGPDGQLVVVGYFASGGVFWSKVADDGSVDTCGLGLPGNPTDPYAFDATFDTSGRLVVAGSAGFDTDGTEGIIVRYLYPSCAFDTTFNLDGMFRTDEPVTISLHAVDLDPSGKLMAGGYSDDGPFLLRLTMSGLYDLGFSGDGHSVLIFGSSPIFYDLAVQPDGKVIVAGSAMTETLGTHWAVTRITADGNAVDIVFGDLGVQRIDWNVDFVDVPRRVVIDPVGGEILVAGYFGGGSVTQKLAGIARLEPDGDLDPTFSVDGTWAGAFGDSDRLFDLTQQSDGKIVAVGDTASSVAEDYLVVRLGTNGELDPEFGIGGVVAVPFDNGDGDEDLGRAIGLSAGRVVVAGSVATPGHPSGLIGVARLTSALIFADGFERASASGWSTTAP